MKKLAPLLIFLAVIALFTCGGISVYRMAGTWGERGTIGDSFGAVNALFSGLAFAGVIYAILLQREELRLQRYELKMTRDELAKSARAQDESARQQKCLARLNGLSSLLTSIHSEMNRLSSQANTSNAIGVIKRMGQARIAQLAETGKKYEEEIEIILKSLDS